MDRISSMVQNPLSEVNEMVSSPYEILNSGSLHKEDEETKVF